MLALIDSFVLFVVAYGKQVKVKEYIDENEGIGWGVFRLNWMLIDLDVV